MNENHAKLCPSPEWAEWLQGEVLPEVTAGIELGGELLEVGPGPGAATDWLRHRVKRLAALEADEEAAAKLTARLDGTNVEVVTGDGTQMTYADGSFVIGVIAVPLMLRVRACGPRRSSHSPRRG